MNLVIAIPTYKRFDLISSENGTLYFLKKMKIPKEYIILFVANQNEYDLYKKNVDEKLYSGKIVIGKKGILNQRNFIIDYFSEGQYILSIDDDIRDILIKNENRLRSIRPIEFKNLIINSYNLMKISGSYIWGINMVTNPLFMKYNISTNLSIIPAGLYGFINRKKSIKNIIKNDSREDVERSIIYYIRDNIIIHYKFITMKTNTKTTEGGIQSLMNSEERISKENLYTIELKKKYPDYIQKVKDSGVGLSLTRLKSHIKINYFNIFKKNNIAEIKKKIELIN